MLKIPYLTMLLWLCTASVVHAQVAFAQVPNVERHERTSFSNNAKQYFTFKQIGGLILVQATTDGHLQDFILDTGASSLIINNKPNKVSEKYAAVGINGPTNVQEMMVDEFECFNIKARQLTAYGIDLSHIENVLHQDIGGLLGKDLIDHSELYIDYESKKIILFNEESRLKFNEARVVERIPFEMDNHFPILKIKIANRIYRFAIDTGCEINLMDEAAFDHLGLKHYDMKDERDLHGSSDEITSGKNCIFDKIRIKNKQYKNVEMVVASLDYLNQNEGNNIDGLLGYPFLSRHKISINFKEQMFYIWE